ncbi:MAG TPA: phosphodiester glycosidase family protein [Kofleriaceae bacterium]|nr:phosphodiester glycosidase family protein [Kofleriaceae bacterium]
MRSWIAALCLIGSIAGEARAQDTWSDPFPGVRRLARRTSNQNINVLVVDLCAAGVSVQTTGDAEKGRVVSSFGEAVGAVAAVNGDFFGGGFGTDGISVHGGAHWSGTDHGYAGPLAFGVHRVELRPHEDQTGPEAWMQEVVSGHPTILWDGAQRDNNGDSLCSARHPRTAVGLSADRRQLIVAVVDGRASTRIGMTCDELSALLREMGADDGMNLDGGGSSTMWLAGAGVVNVPSDGAQRTVANHLGIHASGAGDAPFCPSRPPRGYLDGASCEAITGWAQDEDRPDEVIGVRLSFDGARELDAPAGDARDDLCDAIGSCAHGFSVPVPAALRDGQPHTVQAFGLDAEGVFTQALSGDPMMVTCAAPPTPLAPGDGSLRHITSADSLAAWGLGFIDVLPVTDDLLATYGVGAPMPAAPDVVRVAATGSLFVVDGGVRRPASLEALAAWKLDPAAAREVSPDELAPLPPGAPLLATAYALQGSGPEVYVIDVSDPTDPDAAVPGEGDLGGGCAAGGDGGGRVLVLVLVLVLVTRRRAAR